MHILINRGITPNTIGNYTNWSFPLVGLLPNDEIEDVIRLMDWQDQFIVCDPKNRKLDFIVRLDRHKTCYSIQSGTTGIPFSVSGLRYPDVIVRFKAKIKSSSIHESELICQFIHNQVPHNIILQDIS